MKQGRAVWIVLAAIVLTGAGRAPIYLGILEPPIEAGAIESRPFRIRVAFRFENGRWSAMPNDAADQDALAKLSGKFPGQVSWTIVLDGKKLGRAETARPSTYSSYSDVGTENLTADSKPPAIPKHAADFATWMGTPKYRPLVVVSEPNYLDPDQWRAFDAPAAIRRQAAAAFRCAITPDDDDCHGGNPSSYPDSAILLFGKSYRSKRGDVLIAMRPDPRRNRCDGPVGDEWQSVWFHLKGTNIRRIGSALTLLDIGDYNGDGTAKILFQYDGYDRDGYVLLDPRDDSKTEFSWIYH